MNKIQRELYSKIQEASNIIMSKSRRGAYSKKEKLRLEKYGG